MEYLLGIFVGAIVLSIPICIYVILSVSLRTQQRVSEIEISVKTIRKHLRDLRAPKSMATQQNAAEASEPAKSYTIIEEPAHKPTTPPPPLPVSIPKPVATPAPESAPTMKSQRIATKKPSFIAPKTVRSERHETIAKAMEDAAETARDALRKIGSWLLVGEEHRNKNISSEFAIASTWLMRLGIMAIVACVGFFLKWSMEEGLVTEQIRVIICVISGMAMLGTGIALAGKKYDAIAQGLLGGGIATLYFSMYAAGILYSLLTDPFQATMDL